MDYITDLMIVYGANTAVPEGFVKIPKNLNEGTKGSPEFLCYKKEESEVGIVDIFVMTDGEMIEDYEKAVIDKGYKIVKTPDGEDAETNWKAGGQKMKIAYRLGDMSTSLVFGMTYMDICISDNPMLGYSCEEEFSEYIFYDVDLNKGARGKYIYIVYKNKGGINGKNWMSALSDGLRLVDMSIPGTHDSATYALRTESIIEVVSNYIVKQLGDSKYNKYKAENVTSWFGSLIRKLPGGKKVIDLLAPKDAVKLAKTQDLSIREQLNFGTRFLDFRVDSQMCMHHGITDCQDTYDTALKQVTDFLDDNPSEFVIIRIGDEAPEHSEQLELFLSDRAKYLWFNENEKPLSSVCIDELRGKIIFLYKNNVSTFYTRNGYRFDGGKKNTEPEKEQAEMLVQDNCSKPAIEEKWDDIDEYFSYSDKYSDKLVVNHITASFSGSADDLISALYEDKNIPSYYSSRLNPRTMLSVYLNLRNVSGFGIIVYDFITYYLAWSMIRYNYDYEFKRFRSERVTPVDSSRLDYHVECIESDDSPRPEPLG